MTASIVVTDPVTILDIQDGKRELSCGYTAEVVADGGELNGERFDARQTNIRGNHVAIVDVGRAGPDCALRARPDGAAATVRGIMTAPERRDAQQLQPQEKTMKLSQLIKDALSALEKAKDGAAARKIVTDAAANLQEAKADQGAEKVGEILELLNAAAGTENPLLMEAALGKVQGMLSGASPAPSAPEPSAPEPPADGEGDDDDMDAATAEGTSPAPAHDAADAVKLQARLDAVEAQRKRDQESFAKRVSARVALEAQARRVCDQLGDLSGKTDEEIQRAVVLAIDPEAATRLDVNKDVPGYLQATYDAALELNATRARHADELVTTLFDAHGATSENDPDAVYADFLKRRDERNQAARKAS